MNYMVDDNLFETGTMTQDGVCNILASEHYVCQ